MPPNVCIKTTLGYSPQLLNPPCSRLRRRLYNDLPCDVDSRVPTRSCSETSRDLRLGFSARVGEIKVAVSGARVDLIEAEIARVDGFHVCLILDIEPILV